MRKWVFKALYDVIANHTYSNLYLKNHLQEVDIKDRALATNIFYGTIQNYSYCEYVWKQYAQKKVNTKIKIILSMSVYQMMFLDKIPNYAIISEAVNITKSVSKGAAGFVNAILHKIDKNKIELPENEIEKYSVLYSIPSWLFGMWKAQYGMEQAINNAKYSNQTMPVIVRWNEMKEYFETEELKELNKPLYIYIGSNLSKSDLYLSGTISAQDEGSYEIIKYMDLKENLNVLDCCAAPGTKSMAMAEKMHNTGSITSIDLHEHRVQLIQNDCDRLSITNVHSVCHDSTNLEEFAMYDRVLCDVPCSGYGVLARKPDIKLKMKSEDMDTLIPLQYKILCEASKHVNEGGILVYSTCTVNKKENEKQVEKFLKEHTNFTLMEDKTLFPSIQKDGFYMAKLMCNDTK